jgi:hypothetical protein
VQKFFHNSFSFAERGALAGRNQCGLMPGVGNCELTLRPAKKFVEKKVAAGPQPFRLSLPAKLV